MTRTVAVTLIVTLILLGQSVWAVTWENFIPTALQKSPQVQQVQLRYKVTDLSLREAERELDWTLTLESGKQRDRRISLTSRAFDLEESMTSSASLEKYFKTGTDVSVELISEKFETTSSTTSDAHFNSYFFTVEQNLWKDAFGMGSRAALRAASHETEAFKFERYEALESTLLAGGKLFWQAAILERRFKESQAALERYLGLVKNITNKARNRYASPGELAQVQAEYFNREQLARVNQTNYEQALLDLKVYLPEVGKADLKWVEKFPEFKIISRATNLDITQTRSYRQAELKKDQLLEIAESVRYSNRPQLALVGQLGSTGVDTSASESQKQWIEGRRPSWYVGVKWSHTFGSGVLPAQAEQSAANAQAQEVAFASEKERLQLYKKQLENSIQSLESNLKSQSDLLEARRKAVQELTRHYNQGRIDISILIEAINKAEDAEVQQVQARADLELTYLQWQFLMDQVVLE